MNRRIVNTALLAAVLVLSVAAFALASRNPGHAALAGHALRRHAKPTFRLRVSPRARTVAAGSTATYRVRIRRLHLSGAIRLRIIGGIPPGATVSLRPSRIKRSRSVLIIRTTAATPPGTYVLRLRAKRGTLCRTVRVSLVVQAGATTASVASLPFSISGDLADPLLPGTPQAIDLTIVNPNSIPLAVNSMTVTITALSAPDSNGALPCTLADFALAQYSGAYPLEIPPSSTRDLKQLGVPTAQWPELALIDLPHNQDGCQHASLTLAYTGEATTG